MPKVIAVCRSEKKGTRNEAIAEGVIREDYGLYSFLTEVPLYPPRRNKLVD